MSSLVQLPLDQIAALRGEDVQLYLVSHGWKRDDVASTILGSVYHFPALPDAEMLLPNRRDLVDYVDRMADIVEMLAAVENRSVWQVLADLSGPPADVLRLQVTTPDTTLGTLPIDEGIRLIEGVRSLLLASACSARQAAAFFPRLAYKEAVEFLQTCQSARPNAAVSSPRYWLPYHRKSIIRALSLMTMMCFSHWSRLHADQRSD